MKKLLVLGAIILMGNTAWAQLDPPTEDAAAKEVNCDVKGVQQTTQTADECTALGGTVVVEEAEKEA